MTWPHGVSKKKFVRPSSSGGPPGPTVRTVTPGWARRYAAAASTSSTHTPRWLAPGSDCRGGPVALVGRPVLVQLDVERRPEPQERAEQDGARVDAELVGERGALAVGERAEPCGQLGAEDAGEELDRLVEVGDGVGEVVDAADGRDARHGWSSSTAASRAGSAGGSSRSRAAPRRSGRGAGPRPPPPVAYVAASPA
jgi:hypothetical protein